MNLPFLDDIIYYVASFIAVMIVLTLHEFSHAFVAYKCGDPTPKWQGRVSLNPARHFDLMGLLCFTFVGFGWAKPVNINPANFKKYRLGCILTAVAGVLINFLTAILFYPLFVLSFRYLISSGNYFALFLSNLTELLYGYSLAFCAFNLLPLYPLDGFHVIETLSKRRGKVYDFLRKYGQTILLFLIVESFICDIFVHRLGVYQMGAFNILGYIMSFATGILGYPISVLWGLIF